VQRTRLGELVNENKYADPDFFAECAETPRSVGGLGSAGERLAFRGLLPGLGGKRVLDHGGGFGWHCRYARDEGVVSVVGVDLSEMMLARAKTDPEDAAIEYRLCAIEDPDFSSGKFDAVISSLALHYVDVFDVVCRRIAQGSDRAARSSSRLNIRSSRRLRWIATLGVLLTARWFGVMAYSFDDHFRPEPNVRGGLSIAMLLAAHFLMIGSSAVVIVLVARTSGGSGIRDRVHG
jgi:2-polyprenyl-3-methyl-5-hydroxy-6-metoxy-1,4-benzoquinol methylase